MREFTLLELRSATVRLTMLRIQAELSHEVPVLRV
ncbi:MAG: hypothetical protein HW397_535 [Dehalococcoidia bacterium]|nr:hypothetical protein [Dehalococcoidia bacterium]